MVPPGSITVLLKELRRPGTDGAKTAFDRLQSALRRGSATPEELVAVGRFLLRHVSDPSISTPRWRLRWAGQCTTTWLLHVMCAVAWREGILLDATEADYDNVFQDVISQGGPAQTAPQVYVFLPWLRDLDTALLSGAVVDQRVIDELAFWDSVWARAAAVNARVIQLGFDSIHTGPAGHQLGAGSGLPRLLAELNRELRARCQRSTYWVDLPAVAADTGRRMFYDPRRYAWTKQPFSEDGTVAVAEAVVAGLRDAVRAEESARSRPRQHSLGRGRG